MDSRKVLPHIIFYDQKRPIDVTDELNKYLISLDWTDNMSDKADDLTLRLEDRRGIWRDSWLPSTNGFILEVLIQTDFRVFRQDEIEFEEAGTFEIDEITVKQNEVTIRAVSIVGNSSLRSEIRNQTWEELSLWRIADDIATRNSMVLFWDCDFNPNIDHVEQADQADLEFLQKLCHDQGLCLKVEPDHLIIFDEYKREQVEPYITVCRPGFYSLEGKPIRLTWLTDWQFKQKSRDTYDSVQLKHAKAKEKKTIQSSFTIGTGNKIIHISNSVKDAAEAARLCKRKLRDSNKDATTGSFSTIGNLNLKASNTLDMRGFGKFDGRYIITKASHKISNASFTTSVDIRKCLNGY